MSLRLSICPPVCTEQLGSTWHIFIKFDVRLFLENLWRRCLYKLLTLFWCEELTLEFCPTILDTSCIYLCKRKWIACFIVSMFNRTALHVISSCYARISAPFPNEWSLHGAYHQAQCHGRRLLPCSLRTGTQTWYYLRWRPTKNKSQRDVKEVYYFIYDVTFAQFP